MEKVKAISTKALINIVFLMEPNISIQEYFKIIYYLYHLKRISNILMVLLRLIRGNLMEFLKTILRITKSDSNFAPTFVDDHLLPDINLNGHCLINNNISIPKRVINLYISYILRLC